MKAKYRYLLIISVVLLITTGLIAYNFFDKKPMVINSVPGAGSNGVNINIPNLSIGFDITQKKSVLTGITTTPNIPGVWAISEDGKTFILQPNEPLSPLVEYKITIPTKNYLGKKHTSSLSFTTQYVEWSNLPASVKKSDLLKTDACENDPQKFPNGCDF